MTDNERYELLSRYSRCELTGVEVRRALGGATYGELLRMIGDAGLSLPQAPTAGREKEIALARAWLFPNSTRE